MEYHMSADIGSFERGHGAGEPEQLLKDIERLTRLTSGWRESDLTVVSDHLLETLVEMLGLECAVMRLNDATDDYCRASGEHGDAILDAIRTWLGNDPQPGPVALRAGDTTLSAVAVPMGALSSLGLIVAASGRPGFPQADDLLKLRLAAGQASLAIRELREFNDRFSPTETSPARPGGDELAENERQLNLIINTIPAMVWSATPDGMVDLLNQHFLDFVGLPEEELLGTGFPKAFHPEDIGGLLSTWQSIMETKRSQEIEGRILCADGSHRWFLFRQNPLLDEEENVVKWYGVILDIEDRKCAELALRQTQSALLASEQNLRLIIDSLPVLAWGARPDGSSDFVNRGWAEYVGAPAERILEWGFLDYYHPDDVPGMVKTWKNALETKERMGLKGRIRRYDGEYRWFYFAGQKITDANGVVRWIGANVDIEDLQRAEDAVRENEHRLKLIIDTIPAMAWSATPDGKVDFWHKSVQDFCGLRFEDIAGDKFYRIFHPDDAEAMRSRWQDVIRNRRGEEIDGRVLRADGEYRWCNFRQSPLLDDGGTVLKWYGTLIDIEDRKAAEEKLRQSQAELARVARMTTLGELAVSIAHEVNQPLMAIVTSAGTCLRWLDEAQFDPEQARIAARRVIRDGHRAGEIIANIRALARKSPIRMEVMDVQDAIRDVLTVLNGEFRRRKVEVIFDRGQDSLLVLGDRTQLQQVILNLVMNGVEAMTETGPRVVSIETEQEADSFARVSVRDTGSGLDDSVKNQIFDAFFSTKADGIGMGLSICRSIIEAHGGLMSAMRNDSGGSTFSFTVPMKQKDRHH
jgi:PAS domain S-box-containing protein